MDVQGSQARERSATIRSAFLQRPSLALHLQEVLDDPLAMRREHALGVKLYPLYGQATVTERHDRLFLRPISPHRSGRHFQLLRKAVFAHYEGVVTRTRHRGRDARKDGLPVMLNLAS